MIHHHHQIYWHCLCVWTLSSLDWKWCDVCWNIKFISLWRKVITTSKYATLWKCNYTNKWKYGILFSLTIDISYTVMKLTPVIFFITLEPPFSCDRVYSITLVFILVINGIKLLPMIILTTFIRFIWLTMLKKLKGRLKTLDSERKIPKCIGSSRRSAWQTQRWHKRLQRYWQVLGQSSWNV